MKILILGANGMLGFTLFNYLKTKKKLKVFGTIRKKVSKQKNILTKIDIKDFKLLKKKILEISPDMIINCIGIVKSEVKSISKNQVIKINSKLPNYLNKISNKLNFKLVHISTDCVFSGKNKINSEKSDTKPLDLYGKSKLAGEFKSNTNIVIRTSIIGHEIYYKRGLLEWFLKQEGSIFGFSKAFFSGLTTLELSKIIYEKIIFKKDLSGIYHVSGKKINKYNLLKKIRKIYNKKINIKKESKFSINRTLDSTRFILQTGYVKKSWDIMILENKKFFLKYEK